jgi:hypothetical protein
MATSFIKTLPCHCHYFEQATTVQTCSLPTQDGIIIHLFAETLLETYLITNLLCKNLYVCIYIQNGSLWYCVPLTSSNCNYSFMGMKSKNTQVGSLVHSKFKFRPCKFLIPISIKYKYISFRSVINSFTVSCSNSCFALIFDYFFFIFCRLCYESDSVLRLIHIYIRQSVNVSKCRVYTLYIKYCLIFNGIFNGIFLKFLDVCFLIR